MMVPRKDMEKQLKTQEKELSDDISSLNKKVRKETWGICELTRCVDKILREAIQ